MKKTISRPGSVLQGDFRVERARAAGRAVAQPKASPRPPRPDLLPAKMLGKVGQPRLGPGVSTVSTGSNSLGQLRMTGGLVVVRDPRLEAEAQQMAQRAVDRLCVHPATRSPMKSPVARAFSPRPPGSMQLASADSGWNDTTTRYSGQIYGIFCNPTPGTAFTADMESCVYVGKTWNKLDVGQRFIEHVTKDVGMPWHGIALTDDKKDGATWSYFPRQITAFADLRAAEVAVLEMQGLRIYADSKLLNTVSNPITEPKLDGAYLAGAVEKPYYDLGKKLY